MMVGYIQDLLNEITKVWGMIPTILPILPEEYRKLWEEMDPENSASPGPWIRVQHALGYTIVVSRNESSVLSSGLDLVSRQELYEALRVKDEALASLEEAEEEILRLRAGMRAVGPAGGHPLYLESRTWEE